MSAILEAPSASPRRPWPMALVSLSIVLAGLALLYWSTLVGIVSIWNSSETFAHAFLVLPISLWLVWRMRAELRLLTPRAEPWVLLPMFAMAALWWMGDLVSVNAVTHFALVALLVLAVPATLGLTVSRAILFPLLFLFFMVPIGEFMLPMLMSWTADFTVGALQLSGIPVYREGLQFVIPSGTWSVVEACSGVRYMIASFMVGSLFAYLNYNSMWRRWVFCGISLLVPLVANWLRAYFIVMLGHLSGNKLAVGVDHLIYGWVFFGIVITLMFLIGARWSEPLPEKQAAAGGAGSAPISAPGRQALVAALAVLVMALPQAANWRYGELADAAATAPLALPALAGLSETEPFADLKPHFQRPSVVVTRSYATDAGAVTVHVAYYRQQRPGAKLVSSVNYLITGEDEKWLRLATPGREASVQVAGNRWRVTELMGGPASVNAERQRLEVRQLYWIGGRLTDSDARATVYGLLNRLSGQGDDGAMITIFTAGQNPQDTATRLDAFIGSHFPAIQAQLAAYRDAP